MKTGQPGYQRYKKRPYKATSNINGKINYLMKKDKQNKMVAKANRNYATYGLSTDTVNLTSKILRITGIAAGTGLATRADQNISLSSLYYKWLLTSADATNFFRILFVQAIGSWTGTFPAGTDIFRQASGGSTNQFEMPVNTEQFHILLDITVPCTLTGDAVKVCEGTIYKFKNKTLHFNDSSASSCTGGDIYFVYASDSGIAPTPTISGFAKLKYYQ